MKKQNNYVIANKVKQSLKIKLQLNRLLRHSFFIPRNDKLKKLLFLFAVLFSVYTFSQELSLDYKEYSYSEFFKMIEEEKDSVFKLKDALIKYNSKTDQRFVMSGANVYEAKDSNYVYKNDIVITKSLLLDNVQFLTNTFRTVEGRTKGGVLLDIHFKNNVILNNTSTIFIRYCRFDKTFDLDTKYCNVTSYIDDIFDSGIEIAYSKFRDFQQQIYCSEGSNKLSVEYRENIFKSQTESDRFFLSNSDIRGFYFSENRIFNERFIFMGMFDNYYSRVINNTFESDYIQYNINSINIFNWFDNTYSSTVFITQKVFSSNDIIGLDQFKNGVSEYSGLKDYSLRATDKYPVHLTTDRNAMISKYLDSARFYDQKAFSGEMSLKGKFYNYYKSRYNTEVANQVYIDLKDFETKRLEIIHDQNPGFRSYFKWKVNQFLKLFSDYGTEPSKAIVVSVYVIFFFALIYLFFPNTWDHRGKNRIMDRYRFFLKYVNKNSGIHEVYLDEKKPELLEAEDFKTYLLQQGKTAPKFFTTTALPLYRWSIAGTKSFSWLLSKVDVLKGTWSETSASKQKWKSILIFFAFFVAILYDVFIKVLNALMLSINTFTTLGFGEIPIKGLPRYLAIIQGFIGWFMLTIFSVSLISQLLN
ncbi:MAG: two pore domain potassium channel family protein [Flavobacteriaceae bacterium]